MTGFDENRIDVSGQNGNDGLHYTATSVAPGYECLADVLERALDQASRGKGKERHAQDLPFDQQPMQRLISLYGPGFALGQAAKKAQESMRLPRDRAVAELLGAINYLAGAVIHIESEASGKEGEQRLGLEGSTEEPLLPHEARELADWLRRNGGELHSDNFKRLPSAYRKAKKARALLSILVEHGHAFVTAISPNGKPRAWKLMEEQQ